MNYPHNIKLGAGLMEAVAMQASNDPVDCPSSLPYYGSMSMAAMVTADDCSSGFQSASVSQFPSNMPSSASTTINEYQPQPQPQPPHPQPPPCVAPPTVNSRELCQRVEELGRFISNDNDIYVIANSVANLFSYSTTYGPEVCQLMSESPVILNALYNLLNSNEYKDDNPILFLATGNLTNMSKYEPGRSAILGCNGVQANDWPSRGVKSLINSLQSQDRDVVILAITAVHNLLLDRRTEVREIAKKQIEHADGIKYIVRQLAHQYLINEYEFKVVVLDCLQILAYGNKENRLIILESGGPKLLLTTIEENFDNQPSEELVETASRVLKSLSVCPANKADIIENNGIELLTRCIKRDNREILKTCLWTLRNLSDVINNHLREHSHCVNHLVERLLGLLSEYSEEPCIVTCALGILANLTCNNEPIKQFICDYDGVGMLLHTIDNALRSSPDFRIVNSDILEPAICALCHLINQQNYARMELSKQRVRDHIMVDAAFENLKWASTSEDLVKAVQKLFSLLN